MIEAPSRYRSNREIYSTVELTNWAHRRALIPAEQFLLARYLQPSGRTLEAGTGGGRLLLALRALGFTSLTGFDFVPGLIDEAKKADPTGGIRFEVQDAVSLGYADSSFDQVVYLQQIICLIEDETSRLAALKEAHRVLRTGGTALFSFLSYDARSRSAAYWPYLAYLRLLRTLRASRRTIQYLPWLRLARRFNPGALLDAGPYVYWYKLEEICRLLAEVGFQIAAIGSTHQIGRGSLRDSHTTMAKEPIEGMLYVVAKKVTMRLPFPG